MWRECCRFDGFGVILKDILAFSGILVAFLGGVSECFVGNGGALRGVGGVWKMVLESFVGVGRVWYVVLETDD